MIEQNKTNAVQTVKKAYKSAFKGIGKFARSPLTPYTSVNEKFKKDKDNNDDNNESYTGMSKTKKFLIVLGMALATPVLMTALVATLLMALVAAAAVAVTSPFAFFGAAVTQGVKSCGKNKEIEVTH